MGSQIVNVLGQAGLQVAHRMLSGRYASRSAAGHDDSLEIIRAYERLAEATYFLGETMLPVYAALRGLNLAEVTGSSPELGRTQQPSAPFSDSSLCIILPRAISDTRSRWCKNSIIWNHANMSR